MTLNKRLHDIGKTSDAEPTLAGQAAAPAEGVGAFFLFACVIGSGIMAEHLSAKNDAVALLGNTIATGAILFVLITTLGPISGAHMNLAVSLVAASRGELAWRDAGPYITAQLAFGILGAWAAHLMFDLPTLQLSVNTSRGLQRRLGDSLDFDEILANDDGSVICMTYRAQNGFGGLNLERVVFKDGKPSRTRASWRAPLTLEERVSEDTEGQSDSLSFTRCPPRLTLAERQFR